MERYICIHGHFYQPPRENPWLDMVEVEDSAYPYHDWNARITAECYAPNSASRILDSQKTIIDIVNNYASISFDFGPTLLGWLEQNNPGVYEAVLDADRKSRKRFSGHGAALAQAYNHLIMPLASGRDKRTQVRWGIRDFEHRFGRMPEGMWLPETAADNETLAILADEGIRFTILSPAQALRTRRIGDPDAAWTETSAGTLDWSVPYLCRLPGNRSIAVFFYHGPVAQELAFSNLLEDGGRFADRMASAFAGRSRTPAILSVVSDGETYGHHHRFADMALAYALYRIQETKPAAITVFGEYLARHPPEHEVVIRENTSWSCPHGIERWRGNCGCCTTGTLLRDPEAHPRGPSRRESPAAGRDGCLIGRGQEWRRPLRDAMDRLRDELAPAFETGMKKYVADPWKARDEYIDLILDRSAAAREMFFSRHALHSLSRDETAAALCLLEMQRHALLMYTSCGWFFDDIAGIESVQVMKYACRAMQLAREVAGINPEPQFLGTISAAESALAFEENGAEIYLRHVRTSMVEIDRLVFNYGLSRLTQGPADPRIGRHFEKLDESFLREEAGELRMVAGTIALRSEITCREWAMEYAVLHLGSYDFLGGVKSVSGDYSRERVYNLLRPALMDSDVQRLVRIMDSEFGTSTYSLWHLCKDAQRETLFRLMDAKLSDLESSFRQIYRQHITLIHAMKENSIPIPRVLEDPVWYTLNADLADTLRAGEEGGRQRMRQIVSEMLRGRYEPDRATLGFAASELIRSLIKDMAEYPPETRRLEEIIEIFVVLAPLGLPYDLWESQNEYFHTGKKQLGFMQKNARSGDREAGRWVELFSDLGTWLGVRCA